MKRPHGSTMLDPELVHSWQRRIGATDPAGYRATRYLRRRGREGLEEYFPPFEIRAEDPDAFDEVLYWRPMSEVIAFVLLRTPCTMTRSDALIQQFSSSYVIAGTQSTPGGGTVSRGEHRIGHDHPHHLVMVHNNAPFIHESAVVADIAGVWVPTELLGGVTHSDPESMLPTVSDSLLGRACAAFLTRFAHDVAARGLDVDHDTELMAVDVVRMALRQNGAEELGTQESSDYVQQATRSLIEQHYRDPDFTADSIAQELKMSRRHLYRHFAGTGRSPAALIADRRLARAKELLRRRDSVGLNGIAAASGFASAATMRNRFRAEFGMTPREFRETSTDDDLGTSDGRRS